LIFEPKLREILEKHTSIKTRRRLGALWHFAPLECLAISKMSSYATKRFGKRTINHGLFTKFLAHNFPF